VQPLRWTFALALMVAVAPEAFGQVVGGVMSVTQSHMS
jgi:hypothetical protein